MQKLREQAVTEIEDEVRRLREQLFKLRWQAASAQVDNPNKIGQVRRDIARHLTALRERRPADAPGSGVTR
jgi:large subunit ribosomal protein L29